MKQGNFWSCLLICSMLLCSCRKQAPAVQPASDARTPHLSAYAKEGNGKLCVENAYILQLSNGEWGCPSGKDCSKISPCSAISTGEGGPSTEKFQEAHYNQFLDAIDNNDLQHYFSTNKWDKLFPGLSQMNGVLSGLQNGTITFIKRTNPNGDLFWMAVPAAAAGQNPGSVPVTPAIVRYTLMVPAGTL